MLDRRKKPSTPSLPVFPSYQDAITRSNVHPNVPITVVETSSPVVTLRISQRTFGMSPPGFNSLLTDMLPKSQVLVGGQTLAEHVEHHGAGIWFHLLPGGISIELMADPDCFMDLIPPLLGALYQPIFTPAHLTSTKQELKARLLQEEAKPRIFARKALWRNMFGEKHPFGRQIKPAQVDQVTVDGLTAYSTQVWNAPSLFISGVVCPLLVEKLAKNFPALPPPPTPQIDYPLQPGASEETIQRPNMAQAFIIMGHLTIGAQHPDSIPLYITNELLGGFFGSRLMRNVREKRGYTYGISSRIITCQQQAVWSLATSVKKECAGATLEAIQDEIKDLQHKPVAGEELELLKNYLIGDLLGDLDDPTTFGERVQIAEFLGKGIEYYDHLYQGIQSITTKKIQEMAQQYLGSATCHQVIVR